MAHARHLPRRARRVLFALVSVVAVLGPTAGPVGAQSGTVVDLSDLDSEWLVALDESGSLGDVLVRLGGNSALTGTNEINDVPADMTVWVRGFDESVGILRISFADARQAGDFRAGVVEGAGGASGGCMQVPADVHLVCAAGASVATWQSGQIVVVAFGTDNTAIADLVGLQTRLDPATPSPSGLSAFEAGQLVGQLVLVGFVVVAVVSVVRRFSGRDERTVSQQPPPPQPVTTVPPAPGWPSAGPIDPPHRP